MLRLPLASLRALKGSLALATLAFVLSACSGGSGAPLSTSGTQNAACDPSDPTSTDECGVVLVGFTDAEGDFINYDVDILSLALETAAGDVIEMLPDTTRLDFAQMTDMTEVVSAIVARPAIYVGGSIEVDFSSAEIHVEGANGEIVPAQVVDADGQPMGVTRLDIQLADRDRLALSPRTAAMLTVDFDLAASHVVDTSSNPALVTAQPYIVAEVDPVDEKELRVRGPLVDVDETAGTYTIKVRPWHSRIGDHGRLVVHTTSTTTFEILDAMYEGEEGLRALAAEGPGTLTAAFGTYSRITNEFTAQTVHAGRNIAGVDIDTVYGNVVSRDGDSLLVKGAYVVRPDRDARFHRIVQVDVGPETKVYKINDRNAALDKDAISVGQRIVAFGHFADNDGVAPADPTVPDILPVLDATQGRVRMMLTHLRGTVVSYLPGELVMKLRGIDRLSIEHFDFTGAGNPDPDPDNYQVATNTISADSALSLDNLVTDKWAKVWGFVTPFGMAPPDFQGRVVIDHRDIPAVAGIGYSVTGTGNPFMTMERDYLAFDLTNPDIDQRHHMLLDGRKMDLLELGTLALVPPADGRTLYGFWEQGHIELFKDFGDFVAEYLDRMNLGDQTRSIAAYGAFDETTNQITARKIVVHMIPAENALQE